MNYFQVKIIKHLLEHKTLWLILACLWTLFMTYTCLTDFNSLPKIKVQGVDKFVHITFHFVFTILWINYSKFKTTNSFGLYAKVVVASIVFGSLIEIAQGYFTITRHADVFDVFANTIGSIIAVVVMVIVDQFSSKKI